MSVIINISGVVRILFQGARAHGARVPKFVVTKSSRSESRSAGVRSPKTNMATVFFQQFATVTVISALICVIGLY